MSRIVIVILIYHRHKPIDSINLLGSYRRRNVFPVRCTDKPIDLIYAVNSVQLIATEGSLLFP
jgi:hypothetical protein